MTNLITSVNTYIKNNIPNITIFNDVYPAAETAGIVARHDPATRQSAEFIDGTCEYLLNISYYARYNDAKKARETLTKILNLLHGARLTDTQDGIKIKINSVSNVQFIGVTDKEQNIYSCSVKAIYIKQE